MNKKEATHAYIGKCPHGTVVFLIADVPGEERCTAKEIGKVIRRGISISRGTMEEARNSGFDVCGECDKERKKR